MMLKFDPAQDIPSLAGKICLVTGANSGLGEATLAALVQHNPARVYLAARSHAKAKEALSRIRATSAAAESADIQILDLDLASFDSVKAAAARVSSEVDRLDVLQLNAGVGMIPAATTKDGYEVHFGTNYLGHVLLTQLLMPLLLKTTMLPGADVRIVSMSSMAHKLFTPRTAALSDSFLDEVKTSDGGEMTHSRSSAELYGQANLAKALFAHELAKRYPQITSSSLHPGTVKSNIWSGEKGGSKLLLYLVVKPLVALTGISNQEGAKSQLWCAFSKEVQNGRYYEPVGVVGKDGPWTRDDALSQSLWEWTDEDLRNHDAPGWPET